MPVILTSAKSVVGSCNLVDFHTCSWAVGRKQVFPCKDPSISVTVTVAPALQALRQLLSFALAAHPPSVQLPWGIGWRQGACNKTQLKEEYLQPQHHRTALQVPSVTISLQVSHHWHFPESSQWNWEWVKTLTFLSLQKEVSNCKWLKTR